MSEAEIVLPEEKIVSPLDGSVRPQFGSRHLGDQSDVFKHNAWDQVEWNEEQEQNANEQIEKQIQNRYGQGCRAGFCPCQCS